MFNLLLGTSIITTLVELVKESYEKPIPSENWANKKLVREDVANNVSAKQRIKYAEQGRYKITEEHFEAHPEPHCDPVDGKIVIENNKLYKEDIEKYGAVKAFEWVKQGRYNLNEEELKKEKERTKEEWDRLYGLLR